MSAVHPARVMPYADLVDGLREAKEKKLVTEQADGDLRQWTYSNSCVYERAWDDITMLARGLIIDTKREQVVATPFLKFFNYGEGDQGIPDLPFEVFEKLDGSLIIVWFDPDHGWRTATKGSFRSEQAVAAARWMAERNLTPDLRVGTTYLFEWVAPDNRIVIPYEKPELVLLGAYADDGSEAGYFALQIAADVMDIRVAESHRFDNLADLVAHTATLPATQEGFVLRFANGLRLKIKGEEYRRLHSLISGCTPLGVWQMMAADDDLQSIRDQLPDEFLGDLDQIIATLDGKARTIIDCVRLEAALVADLSDKDVGLRLDQWPDDIRRFIFPYRRSGGDLLTGKTRQALFRSIRPTGNVLPGYTPSYAINRVFEEAT